MKYKFMTQPLESGLYEPEGIYLSTPFDDSCPVIQFWGQHPEHYAQYRYNGVMLKGHIGIDFGMPPGTALFAVDNGRVIEISLEEDGFGRYIKLEHRWGESFYAHLGEIVVESGQIIKRNEHITRSGSNSFGLPPHLHFAIRVTPYNRFDGWGGFSDPLPFMNPSNIILTDENDDNADAYQPHSMAQEKPGMRRP